MISLNIKLLFNKGSSRDSSQFGLFLKCQPKIVPRSKEGGLLIWLKYIDSKTRLGTDISDVVQNNLKARYSTETFILRIYARNSSTFDETRTGMCRLFFFDPRSALRITTFCMINDNKSASCVTRHVKLHIITRFRKFDTNKIL